MMVRQSLVISSLCLALVSFGCVKEQHATPQPEPGAIPASATIAAVQGHGHKSPLAGQRVNDVRGVVTVIQTGGKSPGFWMQSREPDSDPTTSEGLYVSVAGTPPAIRKGDVVDVSGIVDEDGPKDSLTVTRIAQARVKVTMLGKPPKPELLGEGGRPIPTQHIDSDGMTRFDPDTDAIDFWESLEGMLVEIRNPVVVGPTTAYGDIVVIADRGAGSDPRSDVGGVVIEDGEFHPNRITLDTRFMRNPPQVDVGDWFEGPVVGVVDYAHDNYRIVVTSGLNRIAHGKARKEVAGLRGDSRHLTIATYNVENLSDRSDSTKFARVAGTIAHNLRSPDVVAVEEIQDDSGPEDDGTVTAKKTLEKLVDAIMASGGRRYRWAEIDPENNRDGGQPGANIRVAILYNPRRVELVSHGHAGPTDGTEVEGKGESVRLTLSPGRVGPGNPCFSGMSGKGESARKPLAVEFRFHGRTFFVIANHLSSKRGDDPLFGPHQPPARPSEEARSCQTTAIAAFASRITSANPHARVIVLGDMNEFGFRKPIKILVDSGLADLVARVPLPERYTFDYEGNSQVLDHILVSKAFATDHAAGVDIVHVNADFAESRRASDHDPVLARLKF